MKVLHCLNSPHVGGIERLVIEFAIAQKKQGIDVSIMLDTCKGQYYNYLLEQEIPILDSGIKGGWDFNYKTYKQLKKQFKAFQIVHLHSFSVLRSMSAKHSKVKTIYTIHGLSKNVRKEERLKYHAREFLKKWFLNSVDVLIANSHYTLDLARKHYSLKTVKTKTILNGIKLADYTPNSVPKNHEFTIGLVSRFTPRKRIDRLINAFNKYRNIGGVGELILVGNGTEFNTIKKMVKGLGLENLIKMVGYKTNVEDYYNAFDIIAHPSDNEGFGLIAVESFLYGKPIIVFNDSGGMKEVIQPIEPYNIVENEDEYAKRLLFYENHRAEIFKASKNRIAYAKKHFSIERMERDYYKAYKSILLR
ncbi:glycosyltransferase family 4 protein [Flavivirga aquimarina]|uniref:Glycosyltransferase family 4 protein n=1 Tax=Flavivirga aquimarina TaxID=2027862 RepID=A0ABT8W747_9FLAO|nr:glycosyltransferase family 4 protein [Flavivirga aquimarina]MDO5968904.1 glycosyltransferase family 4 protein [Flavivirga aquimarina]